VQKALAAKLDRDPQVQQSIENARRQVLAQAWLEKSASAVAGSSRPGRRCRGARLLRREPGAVRRAAHLPACAS
jgi:hypothetical protein